MFRIGIPGIPFFSSPTTTGQPQAPTPAESPAPSGVRQASRGLSERVRALGMSSLHAQPDPIEGKSYAGIGTRLLDDMGPYLDLESMTGFIQCGEKLDEALRGYTQHKTAGDDIQNLRHEWRNLFATLFRQANAHWETGEQMLCKQNETGGSTPTGTLRPAPDITRLVLRGGGPKGQAYFGALSLLEATGKLQSVREVAGASVGSITGCLIACGGNPVELGEQAWKESTAGMVFSAAQPDSALPSYRQNLHLENGGIPFFLSKGEGMIDRLDKQLQSAILKKLERLAPAENGETESASLAPSGLKALLADIRNPANTPTFGQLAKLAEHFPDDFKHLYLPAFDVEAKEAIYFSTKNETHKDLPISIAVRASAGLPVVFKSLKIDIDGTQKKLIDGGIRTNVPIEAFYPGHEDAYIAHRRNGKTQPELRSEEFDADNANTLLLSFHKGGSEYRKLHSPQETVDKTTKAGFVMKRLLRNKNEMNRDLADDANKSWALGPNTVVLGHGKLQTTSFLAGPHARLLAQVEGEIDMAEYMLNRIGQAVYIEPKNTAES